MKSVHEKAEGFEDLFEDYQKGDYKSLLKKVEKLNKSNKKK